MMKESGKFWIAEAVIEYEGHSSIVASRTCWEAWAEVIRMKAKRAGDGFSVRGPVKFGDDLLVARIVEPLNLFQK